MRPRHSHRGKLQQGMKRLPMASLQWGSQRGTDEARSREDAIVASQRTSCPWRARTSPLFLGPCTESRRSRGKTACCTKSPRTADGPRFSICLPGPERPLPSTSPYSISRSKPRAGQSGKRRSASHLWSTDGSLSMTPSREPKVSVQPCAGHCSDDEEAVREEHKSPERAQDHPPCARGADRAPGRA